MMKHDEHGFILGDNRLNQIKKNVSSIDDNTLQILKYLQGLDIERLNVQKPNHLDDIQLEPLNIVKKRKTIQPIKANHSDKPTSKIAPTQNTLKTKTITPIKQDEQLKKEQHYHQLSERHDLEKRRILREMVQQNGFTIPNLGGGLLATKTLSKASTLSFKMPKTVLPTSMMLAGTLAPTAKTLTQQAGREWQSSITVLNPIFGGMWQGFKTSFKTVFKTLDDIGSNFGFSFTGTIHKIKNLLKMSLLAIPVLDGIVAESRAVGGDIAYTGAKEYSDMTSVNNTKYDALILKVAQEQGIPAHFIKAIMHTESRFDPNAKNSVNGYGHHGLMQLSAKYYHAWGVSHGNRYDPETNIRGGAIALKENIQMLKSYQLIDGEFDWTNPRHLDLLASSYNAGIGTLKNAVKRGGMPTSHENIDYRKKVLSKLNNNLAGASLSAKATQSPTHQAQQRLGAFYLGDSLAVGAGGLGGNGVKGQAVVGLNPSQVLHNLQHLGNQLYGQNVVLSSGLSNNVKDFANVENQLKYLTQTAKAKVTLMGVANQLDKKHGGQLNAELARLAQKYGVVFDGGFEATDKAQIHRSSYVISQKQKSLGSIFNIKASSLASLPQNTSAFATSRIKIQVDNPMQVKERDFVHSV